MAITLILMLISTICAIANITKSHEEKAKVETVKIVEWKPQQEMSSYRTEESFPEIRTISKEEKEAQSTASPIMEMNEEVEATSSPIEESGEQTQVIFSEDEKIAMGKTVYNEARGECEQGRIAIAAVILNRLWTGKAEYGAENGDIMEVITYPAAFAYPKDMTDEFFLNCPEYEICMDAVEAAIAGEDPTKEHFQEGALHFYSLIEELSEKAKAAREGVDTYIIGNQAFHNDMNN